MTALLRDKRGLGVKTHTMQQQLFNQPQPGDTVKSVHTGVAIKVTSVGKYFIVGREIGFVFTDRASTDVRILSFKNIVTPTP